MTISLQKKQNTSKRNIKKQSEKKKTTRLFQKPNIKSRTSTATAAVDRQKQQMARSVLEEPLREKVYYEGCPGCVMDKRKDTYSGLPYREFFYVWIVTLSSTLPASSLYPFLYFMTRDLNITKTEEDIGFYAGFIGASFMLGRVFTSVIWGMVSDRYGRKWVILICVMSVAILNSLFGLSTRFWMAILTRFLLGLLNGLLVPIKAYSSEICRPEHQALGLSLITIAWGTGLIIGPAIGGNLALPAEKYPNIFSSDSLFGRFPYFLPCLCISTFALCTFVACLWLPESLHTHRDRSENSCKDPESTISWDSIGNTSKTDDEENVESKPSLLKNWPLISSIIVYCVFTLHDTAYSEVFSLWTVSDKQYGGLSFSSNDVGEVLAISGSCLFLFQLIIYPLVERGFGVIMSIRIAAVISMVLLSTFTLYSKLSGFWLMFIVSCASLIKNSLSMTIITGTLILQNNAVKQHQRGAANGLSMTAQSLFSAIAPVYGGAIFSLAQKRQVSSFLPGDLLIFFALNAVELLGLVLTFKPFLMNPNKQTEDLLA
ncbi:Major facilitator superfamily antiporter, putative, expressed [Zostera marina]|uniref:Major facilitator superfamily antiporter, putative, expressed n=1 Tax=Zostera marina TaxID=29655 RepID=A0A0K9PTM9_ZOSMR|nr:Major facilitator superfamily antiporter, putative, expressed [Zostera marina]